MKKAVKTLVSFLSDNREEAVSRTERQRKDLNEKTPKAILLACPQSLRMVSVRREDLFVLESFGTAVNEVKATLDYAVRRRELPLLCIMGHHGCDALERAKKINEATDAEKALYEEIAAGLENGPRGGVKRTLYHIDHQVSVALSRYGDLVKSGKLVIVGLYCDEAGEISLTNYNGIKGKEALAYGLPEVEESFFFV